MSFLFPIRFKEHLLGICCVLSSGHMLRTQRGHLLIHWPMAVRHGDKHCLGALDPSSGPGLATDLPGIGSFLCVCVLAIRYLLFCNYYNLQRKFGSVLKPFLMG